MQCGPGLLAHSGKFGQLSSLSFMPSQESPSSRPPISTESTSYIILGLALPSPYLSYVVPYVVITASHLHWSIIPELVSRNASRVYVVIPVNACCSTVACRRELLQRDLIAWDRMSRSSRLRKTTDCRDQTFGTDLRHGSTSWAFPVSYPRSAIGFVLV